MTAQNPSIKLTIRNVQKVGPVVYGQWVLEFDNQIVNDTKIEKLFWVQEMFVIARAENLVLLKTSAVSDVPAFAGGYFDYINLWLGRFFLAELK